MSSRHVCVHGHFYQPPRENPWTGAVEREDDAAPFHDWNARIAEDCYGPIAFGTRTRGPAREEQTLKRISYDFGPTLMSWLERERHGLYMRIVAADRETKTGIAQPYFHTILPLDSRRDKQTLVRWGQAEFGHRFGRNSEGLWLPETAVDNETLEVLCESGISFTILDPSQAAAVRSDDGDWKEVDPDHLDVSIPYLWSSPADPSKTITVFFFHGPLSRAVVEGAVLDNPVAFAKALRSNVPADAPKRLLNIASDGEFYGHHHRRTARTLGRALDFLEPEGIVSIDYARFLSRHPAKVKVKIKERTAWSCPHGLGRWEKNCGCRSQHLPDWSQDWRGPLRQALVSLAARLDSLFEDHGSRLFIDPWKARDESVVLWLRPCRNVQSQFLAQHAKNRLPPADETLALRLLTLQRERLAMFTSCGWFFDDISGPQAVACLQRAARAADLAAALAPDLEKDLLERLRACRSNIARFNIGSDVWTRLVKHARVELDRAAAHAAILDHLDLPCAPPPLLQWDMEASVRSVKAGLAGRDRTLSLRSVTVLRPETRDSARFHAIVHRIDRLDIACWTHPFHPEEDWEALCADFLRLNDEDFRRELGSRMPRASWGLDALLSDERREVVKALAGQEILGYERSLFLQRWVKCVCALRQGAAQDDAVLELLAQAKIRLFRYDELPWIDELENRLHARFEALISSPSDPATISGALRWFNALRNAGLITQTWRLRDAQGRWEDALDGQPCAALDACRSLGAHLTFDEAALKTL
ncbi:MAG: DUF3536 domain-containing protein [Elusimicrobiota bacterium]